LVGALVSLERSVAFAQPATDVAAARQRFDALRVEWATLVGKLRQPPDDEQAYAELRQQAQDKLDQIVLAAQEIYEAGVTDDRTITETLKAVGGLYVTGDGAGDGGDQYEKALPILKTLIDGGEALKDPRIWLWAGDSAYCLNEFDLAEEYLTRAREAGLLGDSPPGREGDPATRAWQLGAQALGSIPQLKHDWQGESEIRDREAATDNLPRVKLETSQGDVVIELFEDEAPQAVASFLSLVKKGYYDGIVFHRVLPQFMAQGGDPTGSGSGGPGYSIRCECHDPNYRRHFRGSLSMAHAGRDTGGSQFFLTFVPTSFLNGRHTVFGRVVEGMENAAALKRIDPQGFDSSKPDKIVKATVLRDRGHAYTFEKLPER
jgi:cyclophilin family peptidyl-prolyl cis-trans isomerase